jgi:hypothetical protein
MRRASGQSYCSGRGFFRGGEDEPYFLEFDVQSNHEMRIDARDSVFDVEIMACADFNDDGLEDLMVLVFQYPKGAGGPLSIGIF